ncbi:hypothetical protein C8A01DRAFT_41851 [Parachaetomium inaequale]|uniref:MYND-type domain-containing protein n=1 Tax=Parachaetomium inaequale TaxID=2588326 RepID=A0AAN6SL53_9PEZI|nr:hypothetical protein C8A01DRAFT_41851 [Parachaetomium inaequale]
MASHQPRLMESQQLLDTVVQAVADDSTGDLDALDNFFRRLPSPEQVVSSLEQAFSGPQVKDAALRFLVESLVRKSTDPDAGYLAHHIEGSTIQDQIPPSTYILWHLGELALRSRFGGDDQSAKARQLRFWAWMTRGRKDETSPFSSLHGQPDPSNARLSHALIPAYADPKRCAGCEKQGPGTYLCCSRCLIRNEGKATFATAYCSKECQGAHWSSHKALCRQVQQLHRAACTFHAIFEHFLSITFEEPEFLKEIAEKDGMVVMTLAPRTGVRPAPTWARFPHHLATSSECGMAALMRGNCNQVLDGARSLFELLIRPLCQTITRVALFAKNMERPVKVQDIFTSINSLGGHEVVVVALPCGAEFALDHTGLQYGWKEKMVPWASYYRHRAYHVVDRETMGPTTPGTHDPLEGGAGKALMSTVALGLHDQLDARFGGVERFLQLKESKFRDAQAAVVAAAKRGLTMLAGEMINSATRSFIIHPPSGVEGIRPEIYWSNEQDKKVANGDAEKLRLRWKARWEKVMDITLPPGGEE